MTQTKLNMAMILAKAQAAKKATSQVQTQAQEKELQNGNLQPSINTAIPSSTNAHSVSSNFSSSLPSNLSLLERIKLDRAKKLEAAASQGAVTSLRSKQEEVSSNTQIESIPQAQGVASTVATPTPTPETKKPLSPLEALRAKLALKAQEESARQTKRAHEAGTLPIDEEIVATIEVVSPDSIVPTTSSSALGMHGETITYNKEQQAFIDLAGAGKPCVLIGPAGTGKTTCSKGGISALISNNLAPVLQPDGHKYLTGGTPGILIISYTRRAVNNIRKVQTTDMQANCITAHKLLEYQPEYYELEDEFTGAIKRTMRFLPGRNSSNHLPSTIHTIVCEEASMLSVELYSEIEAALAHKVQWIFIGDIQQLPPVFGSAILGYKMLELPVVELTQVYRQALESPIIRLAHRILSGKAIPAKEYASWNVPEQLTIHPWKKKLSPENAAMTLAAFFKQAIEKQVYDPDEDIILIPFNKACGTIEINNHIANFLAKRREAVTFEVMAGFNKHYFSAGDRILYDREDAEIVSISANPAYSGAKVQPPSKHLDYWGHNPNLAKEDKFSAFDPDADVDFLLEAVASSEDRVTQSSHNLVIRLLDTGKEITINKAAEVNGLLLSYALTVHKAQGSEWRKVFFCLHASHATMLQRELLYTGVTRAREELYVICEPESFTKGIVSQKIKGNTLAEKAEFFKGKVEKNSNY